MSRRGAGGGHASADDCPDAYPPLREAHGALLVPVRVVPRASRDVLTREGEGLRARLTAPPVDGAANDALLRLLAGRLGLPRRSITLVSGATSRQKVVAIAGLDATTFWRRLGL